MYEYTLLVEINHHYTYSVLTEYVMLSKYKDIVVTKIINYEFELKEFSWGRMVMSSTDRTRMNWLIKDTFHYC